MRRKKAAPCLQIAGILCTLIFAVTAFAFQPYESQTENTAETLQTESVLTEEAETQEDTSGLESFVAGLASLQQYYARTNVISASNPAAEVLAGATGYQKEAAQRTGTDITSAVLETARETIRSNQMSYKDYSTLLQIVEAEATGGDVYSKMLIAGVVMNRVADEHFPDNVYDVVWERSDDGSAQFSPTEDGRIDSVEITEDTIEAVGRVLSGEDYTQGALFFVARSKADPDNVYWFDSQLSVLYAYGGHDFFTFCEYVS